METKKISSILLNKGGNIKDTPLKHPFLQGQNQEKSFKYGSWSDSEWRVSAEVFKNPLLEVNSLQSNMQTWLQILGVNTPVFVRKQKDVWSNLKAHFVHNKTYEHFERILYKIHVKKNLNQRELISLINMKEFSKMSPFLRWTIVHKPKV